MSNSLSRQARLTRQVSCSEFSDNSSISSNKLKIAGRHRAHLLTTITGFLRRFTLGFGKSDVMLCVLKIALDCDGISRDPGFPGQRFVLGYDLVKAAPDAGLAARIMPVGARRTCGAGVSWTLVRGPAVLPSGRVGRAVWLHRDPSCQ